ncbi:MAG: c-type cytochrome [Saprospiraceae bacterium]|nr:c-type cytochrome [Saprospiraceae bacterium]
MSLLLFIAGALLFIVAMVYVVKVNQFLYKRVVSLEAQKSGVALTDEAAEAVAVQGDDFWTRMRRKYWEDAVPIEREGEITMHHAYDGIRELDNRLPPWWVNMFILTIVWSVGYMWYYHWGGNGPSQAEEYEKSMEKAKKERAIALAGRADAVDESNVTVLTDASALGEGELIYKNVCAACHGQQGEGTVGPNFTDEYWIHGGGIKNIFRVIKYGVPEKGMISWQSQLKPADMQKVASYILTMQGTNPPNPKAPQGEIWKEETEQKAVE